PGNEEWANHWFMALARKGDWKLLQQVSDVSNPQAAVKIQKEYKKEKYYFWMVMSIYLQVLPGRSHPKALETPSNSTLLYTLAERMMEKALKEEKIKDYE
ncbi:N-alpha-acetyltransferase 25, NatB auxiliary subunit, partial [Kappamyces sp. JEL0680]